MSARFTRLFGLHVHESLGMTEMAGISTITPPGVNAPAGCVGWRLPYVRLRIVALDAHGNAVFAGTSTMGSSGIPGAFLEWYGANGVYSPGRVFGGSSGGAGGPAVAFGGAVDADQTGSIVFAGEFFGEVNFGTGPVPARDGIFLVKLDSAM